MTAHGPAPPVAAIACGTNSTRLLVADATGATVERQLRVTRLGQGVDATRRLAPEAMERTLAALRDYRRTMDVLGVERARMTATSAARDAVNRHDFLAAAEDVMGVRPELLGGDDEARLSFRSATAGLEAAGGRFLVVDIGGGSTEFAVGPVDGRPGEPEGVRSIDVGCVRLSERLLRRDPPTAAELAQALALVEEGIEEVCRELPAVADAAQLVVLAGIVTGHAAVKRRLATSDPDGVRRHVLHRGAAEELLSTLARTRRADLVHGSGLERALADVIVAGTAILVGIMRHLRFEACLVSEADILDALVLSLLDKR